MNNPTLIAHLPFMGFECNRSSIQNAPKRGPKGISWRRHAGPRLRCVMVAICASAREGDHRRGINVRFGSKADMRDAWQIRRRELVARPLPAKLCVRSDVDLECGRVILLHSHKPMTRGSNIKPIYRACSETTFSLRLQSVAKTVENA